MEKEKKTTTNVDDTAKESEQEDASHAVIPKVKTAGKRIQWLTLLTIIVVSIGGSAWLLWLQPLLEEPPQAALTQPLASKTKPAVQTALIAMHDDAPLPNIQQSNISIETPPPKEELVVQKNKVIIADNNATVLTDSPEPIMAKAAKEDVTVTYKVKLAKAPPVIINHDSTEKLHQELTQLHADITTLRTAITALHQQQTVQQRKQLSNDLNQLLSSYLTFSQQVMLWRNIGNQSQLSTVQQQQALAMMTLAQQNTVIASQWQNKLQKMLAALHTTTPINIIPHDYWWQKWIREHVSLHRQTSDNNQQNERITHAAKSIITRLSQAQWPDAASWQNLRQYITNQQMASSLAHDMAIVEKNTTTMHQLAKQWRNQS